jgi:hypothetical protein
MGAGEKAAPASRAQFPYFQPTLDLPMVGSPVSAAIMES